MKTVKWGILGCGDVCEKKAGPALYGVEHSECVAVMRRTSEKAADFAKRHNIGKWYDSVEDLLADDEIDTIYVATPDAEHHAGTLAALGAGKHVLCEKAMASNTQQCDEMVAAAREAGLTLAVAYYRRGYPTILRAKQLIDDGAIGTVESVHLNDEFPLSHRLDLLHFFNGDMSKVKFEIEDLPTCCAETRGRVLYCTHENGALGVTPGGWDENLVAEQVDIRGSAGRIRVMDLKAGHLVIDRDGEKTTEDLGPLPATHWGIIENFVAFQNGKAPLACDGVEGRKSTVILDIVGELSEPGVEVAVDYGGV